MKIKKSSKIRKSLYRRKYLYDGMERSDIPSIKLENYIEDIKLFYQKSFNDTISSFKMFMYNNKENDTFEFIKELFNFHRERQVNEYYHNKSSILGLIIISGLYDEFENLINTILLGSYDHFNDIDKEEEYYNNIISSKPTKDEIQGEISNAYFVEDYKRVDELELILRTLELGKVVNCYTRRNDNFKGILKQHKDKLTSYQQDYLNKIFKINKLDSFVKKIKVNKDVRKDFTKSSDLKDEIKKFLYYSVCIEKNTRRFIMRHYLLHFIKSAKFFKYNKIITLDKSSSNKENALHINRFLLELESGFRKIRYMEIKYVKKNGLTYFFNTCGETTLLNLLNYYFIKEDGTFNIKKEYSTELKDFYKKYYTITKQLENQEETNKDWLNVVSNLRKKDEDEKNVRLYNETGDIHNNISNINFVLKTILNSEKNHIINILDSVNKKYTIDILEENKNSIKFILNDTLLIFFKPGHGDMIYQNENYIIENKIISDFYDLYVSIFVPVHIGERDLGRFIEEKFEKSIKKWKEIPDILKEFFIFNIISYIVYSDHSIIEHLNKLENLERLKIEQVKIDSIPESIFELRKLKNLSLVANDMKTLPKDIYKLSNLEELLIHDNDITTLPDSIGELRKLKILNLFNNKIVELPNTIGNLINLKTLNLSFNNLKNLPNSIGNLSNLEMLSMIQNELFELPNSIGNLSNLTELYLFKNNLTSLPESICKLKNLLDISYDKDKIKTIPDCLKEMDFVIY